MMILLLQRAFKGGVGLKNCLHSFILQTALSYDLIAIVI